LGHIKDSPVLKKLSSVLHNRLQNKIIHILLITYIHHINIISLYVIYMVKTIRLGDDNLHRELLKIQGKLQAKTGDYTPMDSVIEELVKCYSKKSRSA